MIRNYYTIIKAINELKSLIGCKIISVFSQERNSIIIEFIDSIQVYYVQYNISSQNCSLFINSNFSRAKKNVIELFQSVVGEHLQDIQLIENDRIVTFSLTNTDLVFYLFGAPKSNMIAINKESVIIDSFKNSKKLIGEKFEFPNTELIEFSKFPQETTLLDSLSKSNFNFGKYYAEEICSMLNFNPNILISDLKDYEIVLINKESYELKNQLIESIEYYILKNENNKIVLSLIKLNKFPEVVFTFNSISKAINKRIVSEIIFSTYNKEFKDIEQRISRLINKISNDIQISRQIVGDSARIDEYRKWGELLLSQTILQIKPIEKTLTIIDYDEKEYKIPVNPEKTLLENSQIYFSKAKKEHQKLEIRKERLPSKIQKLEELKSTLLKLKEIKSVKELEKFKDNIKNLIGRKMEDFQNEPSAKYRTFDLGDGYILYVGKNAQNNDELTMKFAKPNDIWMHARATGGSHCVLVIRDNQKPPKKILMKAAEIAAYYSQARNAKYVPVAYTLKKYVRKPKGANPGTVVIGREEVIMAEPKLPQE